MILGILIIIAVVVFALWLGTAMANDPGYVLISYGEMSVQTSIWFAVLSLVVAGLALYWLALFIRWLVRSPKAFGRWRERRREVRAADLSHQGMTLFEEGDYERALKFLVRGAVHSRSASVNYLSAARAATALGDSSARDEYLRLASEAGCPPQAVKVATARMALESGDFDGCIVALADTRHNKPVLELLSAAYRARESYVELEALLPELKRIRSEAEYVALEELIVLGRMGDTSVSAEDIKGIYKRASKGCKEALAVQQAYAAALRSRGESAEAETVIRSALKKQWAPGLLEDYAALGDVDVQQRLKTIRGWLVKHPVDPVLLRCAGTLAIAGGDHQEGARYLERSLALAHSDEAEKALGELKAFNGDYTRSTEHFRRALGLT